MRTIIGSVTIDGPFPNINADGDEIPCWAVETEYDSGREGECEHYDNYAAAIARGREFSRRGSLEFINEAMEG